MACMGRESKISCVTCKFPLAFSNFSSITSSCQPHAHDPRGQHFSCVPTSTPPVITPHRARVCVLSRSVVSNSLGPYELYIARQAPLSMGLSRQEHWSRFPCPSSSGGSSWPRDQTLIYYVSCIGRQILYHERHLGSPESLVFVATAQFLRNIMFYL